MELPTYDCVNREDSWMGWVTHFLNTTDLESHLAAEHTGHAIGEEVEADHQA